MLIAAGAGGNKILAWRFDRFSAEFSAVVWLTIGFQGLRIKKTKVLQNAALLAKAEYNQMVAIPCPVGI
jgi:hypothetical protein